jgi:hypothetical protein
VKRSAQRSANWLIASFQEWAALAQSAVIRSTWKACPCEGGDQFAHRLVVRKMTARLDDLAQSGTAIFSRRGADAGRWLALWWNP